MSTSPPNSPMGRAAGHGHYSMDDNDNNYHSNADPKNPTIIFNTGNQPIALSQPVENSQVIDEIALFTLPTNLRIPIPEPFQQKFENLQQEVRGIIQHVHTLVTTHETRHQVIGILKDRIEAIRSKMLQAQKEIDKEMATDIKERKNRRKLAVLIAVAIALIVIALLYGGFNPPADALARLGWTSLGTAIAIGGYYKISVRSLNKRLEPFEKLKDTHIKLFKAFVEDKQIIKIIGKDWWKTPPNEVTKK